METYDLYGFTNEKSIDINKCFMYFEDVTNERTLITFSELYYKKGLHRNEIPLKPSDFKYILKITIKANNVLIVKTEKDFIQNMFSDDGRLQLELIKRKLQRSVEGCILYDVNELHQSNYVPILYLPKSCIVKVSISYKQTPLERLWISVEDCKNYNRFQCLNSQSCKINSYQKRTDEQQVCKENAKYQLLRLQDLKHIMIPYKFYSFTEYETSVLNTDKQFSHGFKPKGFWFSQGDEWLQHMKKTNFKMNTYNYLYELELDLNKCILITNLKEPYTFTQKFRIQPSSTSKTLQHFCMNMDWNKVVKMTNKSGIVISPNLKQIILKYKNNDLELFKGMEWYVTWDISSGAIWNKDAVKNIQLTYQKEQGTFVKNSSTGNEKLPPKQK
jgi:hypothetical protein